MVAIKHSQNATRTSCQGVRMTPCLCLDLIVNRDEMLAARQEGRGLIAFPTRIK